MTIVVICLAIVVFMPMLAKVPLAIMMNKQGGYNNRQPREQQKALEGLGARSKAAHENCFEATTFFAPTILLVLALNAVNHTTAYLCIAFVVCRLAYLVCYWGDWHLLRSLFWGIGMITIATHYFLLLS
jgi:uncharacterized MAPEG superfamily protein